MSTLYIDRQGSQLSVQNGVVHISTPTADADRRLPIKYIQRIVLRTDTQLSSKVLCALAEYNVSLVALGGRGGHQISQMVGAPHNDATQRWQQVIALSQPAICAQIATTIIVAKVKRQRETLQHIADHRADLRKPMHDGRQQLSSIVQTLQSLSGSATRSLGQIRGYEGTAAAMYFDAFFTGFAPALGAKGRNRRPPKDPVNAVLSLSYTLLYAQASTACWTVGLDPALGALHTLSHGRAALACDLMEPFRPSVDLWVWELFRSDALRQEHFGHDGSGACLLGKAGRSHFYCAWEQRNREQQRSLNGYARSLASAFKRQAPLDTWDHLFDPTNGTKP